MLTGHYCHAGMEARHLSGDFFALQLRMGMGPCGEDGFPG
jgi:hypothetical protein